ncbi:eIF2A-related protein [Chlorobaculum parvum]|nr:pentapeptide repeat-containing protein [Chlorobaculum parvum]
MPDSTPPNHPPASARLSQDASNVEQAMKPGYAEMAGYRSSEAVEIRATIKPRIELFLSYAHNDKSVKQRFTDELKARLAISRHFQFVLSSDNDLLCGDTWHDELQDRLSRCNYGILLLSNRFLASTYIQKHEIPLLQDKCFPVALKPIDIDNLETHGLDHRQIFFFEQTKPFQKVSGANLSQFINDFVEEIEKSILKQREKHKEVACVETEEHEVEGIIRDEDGTQKFIKRNLEYRCSSYECERFIDTCGLPGVISHQTEATSSADTVQARPYIRSWALESDVPFFALLGDFGTGKTFTCRMLAREINALHDESPESVPLCIYIDLRRVSTRVGAEKKVPRLVDVLRDAIEFTKDPLDKSIVTPEDVIRLVRSNRAMILFDGLDEKTVHFSPEETNRFIAELWSIREQRSDKENAPPQGKILISCRTHYFRDTIEQNTLFLGRDREGRSREEYRSCTLLPFDAAQIREYLEKRLGCDGDKIESIIGLFGKVHNLKELASRPYTLNLMTEFIPDIERLASENKQVNTATLYDTTVENWLARDEGKHEFSTSHKKRLMKSLAAELHRRGGEGLETDDLDDWLDDWLADHPAISEAYRGEKPRETLKKDLRTATFIIREEEDNFSFAHTSLQEYFLAGFLVDGLSAREFEPQELAMNMPSKETLDFVADMLAADERKGEKVVAALASILENAYRKEVSELAFALWLKLHERGMRTPAPRNVRLEQAELAGWVISNLNLSGARFDGANLRGTSFRSTVLAAASFSRANLVNAEFLGCNATGVDYSQADADAGILRNCDLRQSRWAGAELRLASFVECEATEMVDFPVDAEFVAARCEGIVSSSLPEHPQLSLYDGHSVGIKATSFNSDGTKIASGSADGTVKLWDAKSGTCLITLIGHTGSVNAANFNPDSTRVVSGSGDKTVKIWDTYSGNCISTFFEHALTISDCSFSPDGKYVISSSYDKTIKIWNVQSGHCISTLCGHLSEVNNAKFSPDGERIISASSDKMLKIWDARSGQCLLTLSGHTEAVWSCAFSPDGTRIISASSDHTLKIWEAQSGNCIQTLSGHTGAVWSCAFSPNGTRIISASYDNTLKLWDAFSQQILISLPEYRSWFDSNSCAFSPDGTKIISTSRNGIKLWESSSGQCIMNISKTGGLISACAFNPSGNRFISGSHDHFIKLWETESGRCVKILAEYSNAVLMCAFSPDGSRIISVTDSSEIKLFDSFSGQVLMTFKHKKNKLVQRLCFQH